MERIVKESPFNDREILMLLTAALRGYASVDEEDSPPLDENILLGLEIADDLISETFWEPEATHGRVRFLLVELNGGIADWCDGWKLLHPLHPHREALDVMVEFGRDHLAQTASRAS